MSAESEDVFGDRGVDRLRRYFNSCGLSPFGSSCAIEYLRKSILAENGEENMHRVIQYLLRELNSHSSPREIPCSPYQKGCPNILEGLSSHAFWDTSQFPWVKTFEDSYHGIRREVLELLQQSTRVFQVLLT